MKNLCFLFWACCILSCTANSELNELQDVGSTDYFYAPDNDLSSQDKLLVRNVDFQEGQLFCLLDIEEAITQGISKEKYEDFLNYLRKENQKIEESLDSGYIVFYNGEPFTRNEELYQYVEFPNQQIKSRVTEYDRVELLYSCSHEILFSNIQPSAARFVGPAKITVRLSGKGNLFVNEPFKGFKVEYVNSSVMSEATFKWGVGNYTTWTWNIKHTGSTFSIGHVDFYGHFEKEEPLPSRFDPRYLEWYNNLPSYVRITKVDDSRLCVQINQSGSYTVRVYRKSGTEYILYDSQIHIVGFSVDYVSYPANSAFWVVVYKENNIDGEISYQYVGDKEFRLGE